MPNILDEAVRIAAEGYLDNGAPNPAEMKRATQLVQRILTGQATNTDRIALKGILGKIGTTEQEVIAALREESLA